MTVGPIRKAGWVVVAIVVALVATWAWRRPAATPAAPRPTDAAIPAVEPLPAQAPVKPVYPGGVVPADPASLSPAERSALQDREKRASAAAPPATSYTGIDGRKHAFQYPDAAEALAAERVRQGRRERLMAELAADPAAFARAHRMSLDEVRLIVDGETDFPDRLLDP